MLGCFAYEACGSFSVFFVAFVLFGYVVSFVFVSVSDCFYFGLYLCGFVLLSISATLICNAGLCCGALIRIDVMWRAYIVRICLFAYLCCVWVVSVCFWVCMGTLLAILRASRLVLLYLCWVFMVLFNHGAYVCLDLYGLCSCYCVQVGYVFSVPCFSLLVCHASLGMFCLICFVWCLFRNPSPQVLCAGQMVERFTAGMHVFEFLVYKNAILRHWAN